MISDNVKNVMERVAAAALRSGRRPEDVTVVAAIKTVAPERILEAVEAGITQVGENRVQELLERYDAVSPSGAQYHFIGQLQTNKVKYIIDKVAMIQSVDSERLMREIQRQAARVDRVMDILIEVNVGGEESKGGITPDELPGFVETLAGLPNLRLRGLMAIPPVTEDEGEAAGYFERMRQLFVDIRGKSMDNTNINLLSMGMSGDYELAIEHGANMVRIGTGLFGSRNI